MERVADIENGKIIYVESSNGYVLGKNRKKAEQALKDMNERYGRHAKLEEWKVPHNEDYTHISDYAIASLIWVYNI